MHSLPNSEYLPIHKLVACFNRTTAAYKFYWLLSILEQVEKGKTLIPKQDLFAGMISHAWYTVHYFHVSFGKQDLLGERTRIIKEIECIPVNADKKDIRHQLSTSKKRETVSALNHFDRYVPHQFLSPWLPKLNKQEVYRLSNQSQYLTPYSLQREFISVHLLWANYFRENAALIKSFCYWKLSLYLQQKNPNVPDIPNKLIRPPQRNSLSKQREYWDLVIGEMDEVKCIYSNSLIKVGYYALDHFVPYSFVSHDLIWNLIPTDMISNSSKGDKLPLLQIHFEPFYNLQKQAIDIMIEKRPRAPLLQDFFSIFSSNKAVSEMKDIISEITKEQYLERIQPLITIAANNGFEFMST